MTMTTLGRVWALEMLTRAKKPRIFLIMVLEIQEIGGEAESDDDDDGDEVGGL